MKLQWSLVMLASSMFIVSAGAMDYLKSQTLRVETKPRPPAVVARPLPAIVALGRLEPSGRVIHCAVSAQSGHSRLETLLVKQGDRVKKGQVLAVLDGRAEHEAALDQSVKQLAVARAELDRTVAPPKKNDLDAQQSVVSRLEAEFNNAVTEQGRYRALYKEGAVAASVLDSKNLTVEMLQQQISQAKANLSSISEVRPVDIEVASAQVDSARSSVVAARAQLELDYVLAPIDGQVLKINSHAGETADARGILDLGNTSCMYAVAEVYEADASRLQLGQRATIQCDALPYKVYGSVQEIGLQIEKKQTLDADTAADIDSRIVETRIRIDPRNCARVAGYTNSHIKVMIDTEPRKS